MPELTADLAPTLVEHLKSNLATIAESYNQCFDLSIDLISAETIPLNAVTSPDAVPAETAGAAENIAAPAGQSVLAHVEPSPGVAVLLQFGTLSAAVLISESLLLPGWYRQPNTSQQARLDTLAMEWGMNLFPADFEANRMAGVPVWNLQEFLASCYPGPEHTRVSLAARDAEHGHLGSLHLVWPLSQANWTPTPPAPASAKSGVVPEESDLLDPPDLSSVPDKKAGASSLDNGVKGPDPLARLRKLPVMISVRLTERRISMSQLLAITPGALLTFPSSCDDLLDLYVNNALYCRGEAVKIGEKFGLKINEVGVQVERPHKILEG